MASMDPEGPLKDAAHLAASVVLIFLVVVLIFGIFIGSVIY